MHKVLLQRLTKIKELRMQEVKREQLNLVQIAKRQNIPYGKLYHTYLVLGSISEAIKVCRKPLARS